jgi:hypothetical protein
MKAQTNRILSQPEYTKPETHETNNVVASSVSTQYTTTTPVAANVTPPSPKTPPTMSKRKSPPGAPRKAQKFRKIDPIALARVRRRLVFDDDEPAKERDLADIAEELNLRDNE